jgi:hypothetical protein
MFFGKLLHFSANLLKGQMNFAAPLLFSRAWI